jgi:hypothetical protein
MDVAKARADLAAHVSAPALALPEAENTSREHAQTTQQTSNAAIKPLAMDLARARAIGPTFAVLRAHHP